MLFPFGLFVYVIFGSSLKFKTRRILKKRYISTKKILNNTNWIKGYKKTNNALSQKNCKIYNKNFNLWHYQKIKAFCFGKDFIKSLLLDIKNAKKYIFLQFYIIASDNVGNVLKNALLRKAKEGIVIKVLYDDFGSHDTKDAFWQKLKDDNIEVIPFFPSRYKFLNNKVNYRNHRKLVIIDGLVAYIGGLNIRDDHMGRSHLSPWKDLMIKINGGAVYPLLNIFLNDYISQTSRLNASSLSKYFTKAKNVGNKMCQVITSGPDSDKKHIYNSFLKAIKTAKKYICIQTPYLILDASMQKALKQSIKKGACVDVIIPGVPDKEYIYSASLHYAQKLVGFGAKVYLYNGFIHSKVLLVDNNASIGSCNFDNRSFKINFEDTLTMYDKLDVLNILKIIKNDKQNSTKQTLNSIKQLRKKYKINSLVLCLIKYFI